MRRHQREPDGLSGDGVIPTLAELVALRAIAIAPGRARRVRASTAGFAPSALRGRGMEYAESREYTRGDDARHMDWRLTARTGRPHTKVFQAERERMTLIVADTAPSMYFGSRVRFKSVQAARAGALVAWSGAAEGDRIAALRGSAREAPVPPGAGTRGALHAIEALSRWYATRPAEDLGLAHALERAQRLLRPGARLVVLADASSLPGIPPHRWTALARHHDVVVVIVFDPFETDPPRLALPVSVDGRPVAFPLEVDAVRRRWLAAFAQPLHEALAELPGRGVRAMALSTADPSEACLALLAGAVARVA
ncbi:MAG: DUF58 domain-containing protein [Lysobacter sp.]|nr:MAG: DUF58 domain-containing protein [Lysobacter sp.]